MNVSSKSASTTWPDGSVMVPACATRLVMSPVVPAAAGLVAQGSSTAADSSQSKVVVQAGSATVIQLPAAW